LIAFGPATPPAAVPQPPAHARVLHGVELRQAITGKVKIDSVMIEDGPISTVFRADGIAVSQSHGVVMGPTVVSRYRVTYDQVCAFRGCFYIAKNMRGRAFFGTLERGRLVWQAGKLAPLQP
jgi:hypothetical protein